ncbi:MAG: hypothetical protein GF331_11295 [Chitinivibrionales bacterium]|nr:hypothetical protein [Chitinivibrionales bacterium]
MGDSGGFCTAINCMDGRTQAPVNEFLAKYFGVAYVDAITEPGPIRILADRDDPRLVESIVRRVRISVDQHGSVGIGIVAHDDCAGNPVGRDEQLVQLRAAIHFIRSSFEGVRVVGLWLGEDWKVELQSERE